MGLLTKGTPMEWSEMVKWQDHVKKYGVHQFIRTYNRLKHEQGRGLKWGDEIEYYLVKLDHKARKVRVSLRAEPLLHILAHREDLYNLEEAKTGNTNINLKSGWRPEFCAFQIESCPGIPYEVNLASFNSVEHNMRLRRLEVAPLLEDDEILLTTSSFPLLGTPDFTWPVTRANPRNELCFTKSLFWPSTAVYLGHPRYSRISTNIRERKGEKVSINVPIYKDERTPSPFTEDFSQLGDDGTAAREAKPDHVYMDATAFGMGLCCLQVTFQAESLDEARRLYDQLVPLCPIMLALTASSPAHRGYLVDTDCRWSVISQAADDRTKEEKGLEPLKKNKFVIPKSRYDSVDCYLSSSSEAWPGYNDTQVVYDPELYKQLVEGGVDHLMAKHVAHLFIRDSISIFKERIREDGKYEETDTDHFENIQSTNYQTLRFKPPPPGGSIGWRVEFRPCELQFTDFENAAVASFIVLLTRAILSYKWNLLMPISLVEENMKRCLVKDAILDQKFYWRTDIFTPATEKGHEPKVEELTVDQIMNGIPGSAYQGLLALVRDHVRGQDEVEADTMCTLSNYWQLMSQRAAGKLLTNAHWIRNFIRSHPEYRLDSKVPEGTVYDLILAINAIQTGELSDPSLFVRAERRTKTADYSGESESESD